MRPLLHSARGPVTGEPAVGLAGLPAQQTVTVSNRRLRGRDKIDVWHAVVEGQVLDLHASACSIGEATDVSMTGIAQERSGLVRIASSACRVERAPRFGGDGWADSIVVNVLVAGQLTAEQDGHRVSISAGDGIFCLADKPYSLWFPEPFEAVVIRFDRSYFAHLPLVSRLRLAELSRAGHVGNLVSNFAADLSSSTPKLTSSFNVQLIQRLADLLETALAVMINGSGAGDRRIVILSQVKAHIRERLKDPDLSLHSVSEAMNLPSRYLRKLFNDDGTSVRQYILQRRLALCAADLNAPHLKTAPISSIAFRHGFKDAAHFSRAFRARYGVTPSDVQIGPWLPRQDPTDNGSTEAAVKTRP